jgi:hypothetical protein
LRGEIRSLQSDNLKLYEKVRYMQSYRENAHSTLDPLPTSSTSAPSATELNKYSARYEEAMNPFEAFRGRVRNFLFVPTNHTAGLINSRFISFFRDWREIYFIGGSAGLFKSEPARAWRFRVDSGDSG